MTQKFAGITWQLKALDGVDWRNMGEACTGCSQADDELFDFILMTVPGICY